MTQHKIIENEIDPAQKLYPDLPSYAATEAEFLALVEEGLASIEEGPLVDHATLMAELHQVIHGKA